MGLSEDPSFAAELQAEIESTVGVKVEGMQVSAPKTVVEYEVTQDPVSKDDSDEGGSPVLIIVGLLLVVGLGFGAWKMKQGSSCRLQESRWIESWSKHD